MDKLKNKWHLISRHKYWVTVVAFLLIICVFDENNLIKRMQHKHTIHQLEKEIKHYEGLRDSSVRKLQELHNDGDNLERVAREKYGMHLPDEEIFIIK